MLRLGLVALSLVALLVAPAIAESPLVVVDSQGAVLGDAIEGYSPTSGGLTVLLRRGGQDFVIITVDNMYLRSGDLYYDQIDCQGLPWASPASLGGAVSWLSKHQAFVGPFDTLYKLPETEPPPHGTILSHRRDSDDVCENQSYGGTYLPVEAIGPAPTFTPPLALALNPVIFADQFQTGDMSRWSNY